MEEEKRTPYWIRYSIILLLWLVVFGIAFTQNNLTDQIESSTNIVNEDTSAAQGQEFYHERFEIEGDNIQHIIVLHLPESGALGTIRDQKWVNYTYYLSYFLLMEYQNEGYNSVLSYPVVLEQFQAAPNAQDIANSFISADNYTSLIYLQSSTLNFEDNEQAIKDHVHGIRDTLTNYTGLVDVAPAIAFSRGINPQSINLPSEEEVTTMDPILTGTGANIVDTLETSEESFRNSEIIAAIAVLIILVLVFRTPLGIVIPALATAVTLIPAYWLSSVLADWGFIVVNDFLPSVIAMIGIAVAVDYNLFNLVRYREEFRKRRAKHETNGTWNPETIKETQVQASKVMNNTAGRAVMYSGITVMIGFSALLIADDEFSFAMAIGVTIVVFISVLTARTFTPALLGLTGRFLDWPNFISGGTRDVEEQKDTTNTQRRGFWVKWSNTVMRYPLVFLLIGLLTITPFIVLSSQTTLSFSLVKSLPEGTESREGFEIIEDQYNLGDLNPFRIVIDTGSTANSAYNNEVLQAINNFNNEILDYEPDRDGPTFQSAVSLSYLEDPSTDTYRELNLTEVFQIMNSPDQIPVGSYPNNTLIYGPNIQKQLFLQHAEQYLNLENGNNTLLIDITSNIDPGSSEAWDLIDVIETIATDHFDVLEDTNDIETYYITGLTALFKYSSDRVYDKVPLMLSVAVILIFIALMILFRSLLLPIKAILTIAGSIMFSLGALVFVFQQGNFTETVEFLGYTIWTADQTGIAYILPVFLFTTILGLGMDYSIFIISRIKETKDSGENMTDSVGIGLSKTAGVVTSAATIMIVTFMVFALSPMLILKMMGMAMAIAIFIDATIARIILLPAAMKLAGKYNFWLPKWLEKILPDLDLEH